MGACHLRLGHGKVVQTQQGGVSVPANYGEAMRSGHSKAWRDAMEAEIKAHYKAGTWQLMPFSAIPAGQKPIGSTWAFAVKRDSEGHQEP